MRKDDHFSKATSNKPDPHSESANGLAQTGVQNAGGPPYYSPCIVVFALLYVSHVTCYVSLGFELSQTGVQIQGQFVLLIDL